MAVSVNVHVEASSALSFRAYRGEDRVTVQLGDGDGDSDATLFLPRAEIFRLAEVLANAVAALDGAGPVRQRAA